MPPNWWLFTKYFQTDTFGNQLTVFQLNAFNLIFGKSEFDAFHKMPSDWYIWKTRLMLFRLILLQNQLDAFWRTCKLILVENELATFHQHFQTNPCLILFIQCLDWHKKKTACYLSLNAFRLILLKNQHKGFLKKLSDTLRNGFFTSYLDFVYICYDIKVFLFPFTDTTRRLTFSFLDVLPSAPHKNIFWIA
jgi:hypothetical protein